MEQFEDGIDGDNVLAKLPDEPVDVTSEVRAALTDFVLNVFRHIEGKRIAVGQFRGVKDAEADILHTWSAPEPAA